MYKNNGGFTLIEFLVAIVILMVGLLGLLQAVNVSLEHNLKNQLRNEAVSVGDEFLNNEISKTFDLISTPSTPGKFLTKRKVSVAFVNYSIQRSGSSFSNSKQVNISISWRHKGNRFQHETMAVVSKNQ